MILGYEQPVDIPMMSMYDKDMMKMYLGALQRDYEQGISDVKEFQKSIGDFYSPIDADMNTWNNLTTVPMQQLLRNPDLIRSVEGRALIQNFINTRPYGEMAKLRQSAEAAQQYVKNRDELKRQGLYSEAMDKWENPVSVNDWDTMKNGAWTTTSPSVFKTYDQMLKPIVDQLNATPHFLKNKDKYTQVWGVSDDRIQDSINANYEDLMAQPSMQYLASTVGNDPEAFKQVLFDRIKSKMREEEKIDEGRYKADTMSIERQRLALARQKAVNTASSDKTKTTDSYRFGVWRSAMAIRGINDPTGQTYVNAKIARALDYVKNMKVYSKSVGKSIPFSQLSNSEKQIVLRGNGPVSKKYQSALNKFDEEMQSDAFYRWRKNGGYASNASLSLAQADDSSAFVSQYDDAMKIRDNGNLIGYGAPIKQQFHTITEVTGRTGQWSNIKGHYSENDNIRNRIISFTPITSNRNMIVQYEKSTHSYHAYRLVRVTLDDNTKQNMWMETFNPTDWESKAARDHDSKALHAVNQGVSPIGSALTGQFYTE